MAHKTGLFPALAVAFSAAAVEPLEIPTDDQILAADKVCIVMMTAGKRVVTAKITDKQGNNLVLATDLTSTETGMQGDAVDWETNKPAGSLAVAVTPFTPGYNERSQRPVSCTVGGETYPVQLPDVIRRRLFSPSPGQ